MPIFDRNQGEIARTQYAITQSQELSSEQASIALTDVTNSYEALRTDDQVVQLYQSGYLKKAEDSRDISQYAYQHGSASLLDFLDAERSYRATELRLPASARKLHDLARATAPGGGNQEFAMTMKCTDVIRCRRSPRRLRGVPRFSAARWPP